MQHAPAGVQQVNEHQLLLDNEAGCCSISDPTPSYTSLSRLLVAGLLMGVACNFPILCRRSVSTIGLSLLIHYLYRSQADKMGVIVGISIALSNAFITPTSREIPCSLSP